ncbi:WD repeat-containing protein on Y chromosome -like protein [Tribolium castaneum]|uniref:WD repeat-containing protein on Y chromosome-like protein n=1 Tax=Tribolium castaneum TaxID=7070 RepID=A0A139WFW6_TRICA|nr:WD repeat-containing protein on Y chromosome -like protein [Tribolium castaneum]
MVVHSNAEEDTVHSWYDLIQNLTVPHLDVMQNEFQNKNDDKTLTKEEFFNTVNAIFANTEYSQASIALYEQIAKNGEPQITWSKFVEFFLQNLMPADHQTINFQVSSIIAIPQTKRETIIKIVRIETEKYFCYAMISKHGRVGLYDGNLNFLTTYQLIMTREDIHRKEEDRRRRNRWVTDAIFCADVLMFIATNTARSVVIYEASGLKHVPLYLVLSTPNIVQCFAYKSSICDENGQSTLFMGDDKGTVFSFTFLQPKAALLRKKHNDRINLFYWDELPDESDYVVVKRNGRLHQESVKWLVYFNDNETLISCSKDSNVSILIHYIGNKNKPYIFKIQKGCNCFALSRIRKILATGSENSVLRLWNPIITSKPIAILKGHQAPIMDVKILDKLNLLISCSADAMFKLWDLEKQKCIQSFSISFPSFKVFGKLIEWGIECIYPGPKRTSFNEIEIELFERSPLLITCCNHIAVIKIVNQSNEIQKIVESQVLPPPPLQNSVLIPKMWRTSDSPETINKEEQFEEAIDDKFLKEKIKELEFILKKDLFANDGSSKSDINFKIATLERKKVQMRENVARGAPYLALELPEVSDLYLTPNLPVPDKKKTKNIVEKIEKVLQDASYKDLVFSEPSSSRSPRSSRSSVIEFD